MSDLSSLIPLITSVAGTAGNIISSNQQAGLRNKVNQDRLNTFKRYAAMTPATESAGIQSMTQPLSADLVAAVARAVKADLAARGLLQSPGMFADAMATALAPFILQQQRQGSENFFAGVRLPLEATNALPAAPAYPNAVNAFAPLAAQLAKRALAVPPPQSAAPSLEYTDPNPVNLVPGPQVDSYSADVTG